MILKDSTDSNRTVGGLNIKMALCFFTVSQSFLFILKIVHIYRIFSGVAIALALMEVLH